MSEQNNQPTAASIAFEAYCVLDSMAEDIKGVSGIAFIMSTSASLDEETQHAVRGLSNALDGIIDRAEQHAKEFRARNGAAN